MKKAGIFAAVIAAVLLFMQFYNYRLSGYTDDVMYVIDSKAALSGLKEKTEDGDVPALTLKQYQASSPLYTRGDRYFIGEDHDALDRSYPVYVNEGSYLYTFSDEMDLVTADFSVLNAYDGLYVTEGHTYNRDRELADPDEFIFLSAGDGLFMNVQDMVIRSQARERRIQANSLMDLGADRAAYYEFQEGSYVFGEYKDLIGATVSIGSLTISYEDLLASLKQSMEPVESQSPKETETIPEETEEETQAQTKAETLAAETQAQPQETEASQTGSSPSFEEALTETSEEDQEKMSHAETEESLPDHPPIPGDRWNWEFPGEGENGATDGEDDSNSSQGGNRPGNGGSSDSGSGGSDGEAGDGSENIPGFEKPEASISPMTFSVYYGDTDLQIHDPSHLIQKGVRLVLYKEGDTRASYRKLYRTGGKIRLEPLAPDTGYELEGYFDYDHPQYGKVREVFAERAYCGKTLPVSALTPLHLTQQPDSALYSSAIQISGFQLLPENEEEATPSQASATGPRAASYISSVQLSFKKLAAPDWSSPHASLSSSLLASLKAGKAIQWKTGDILDSNSRYRYELTFFDRFGNVLPLADQKAAAGETRTSKLAPKAAMKLDQESDINELKLKVTIENKDKADFTDGKGGTGRPYLYLTYAAQPETPVFFTLKGDSNQYSYYELTKDNEELVFSSLLPSTAYTIWVRGNYDLEDGREYSNQVIGSLSTATDSLSSLGTISFYVDAQNIKNSSAEVTARLRAAAAEQLYPFLSIVEFTLTGDGQTVYTKALKKEELEQEMIAPGGSVQIQAAETGGQKPSYTPEITLTLPAEDKEKNLWEALLTSGTLKLDFKEGELASCTSYQASFRVKAVRGSNQGNQVVTEDVTGRYYQASFKTLKQPAYISYDMSFINGSSATFYNLDVHDPDGAVIGGKITARIRMRSNNKVTEIRSYTVEELNRSSEISFSGLEEEMDHVLELIAPEYNEGYTNSTKHLQKMLLLEDGSEIRFKTVNSLQGSLNMDSMKNGYEAQTPSDGMGVEAVNLFDINKAVLNTTLNSGQEQLNTSYSVTDYIRVEQDTLYFAGGGMGTTFYEYDESKNYLRARNLLGPYVPSRDAVYVRNVMTQANMNTAFISKALFAEADSKANLVKQADIKTGTIINTSTGNEQVSETGACTGFIDVKPGDVYIRAFSADIGKTQSWTTRAVIFFDENKQRISNSNNDCGAYLYTVPENASYVRLNMSADYTDRIFFGKRSEKLYGENLLENAVWNEGKYVTWNNRYSNTSYPYQKYCDYIEVKPSTIYYARDSWGIQAFDRSKKFLGYWGSAGSYYIRTPEDAAYIRMNTELAPGTNRVPSLIQSAPSFDRDNLTLSFMVRLDDGENFLGESPAFTLEYKKTEEDGSVSQWSEALEVDPETRRYEALHSIKAEPACQYTITQTVTIGGNRIVLNSVSLGTARVTNIVRSEAALKAIGYSPMDDYRIEEDIEVHSSSLIPRIYGTLDLQGHEIRGNNVYTVIDTICEGATLENGVIRMAFDTPHTEFSGRGLLSNDNRGTMRNLVLYMSIDNRKNNSNLGGLTRNNYGTIESFGIQLTGNVYGRSLVGTAAASNYGQITNGYLVSDDAFRITIDPGASALLDRSSRGGLVGMNRGGVMKNLYSAVVIEDWYPSDATSAPTNPQAMGLITGYARGEVRYAFGVGMTLANGVPPVKQGPAVGSVSVSQSLIEQINYIETMSFEGKRYSNIYNNQALASSLWKKEWMDQALHNEGAFLTAMAEDGYYPQLDMPQIMAGKQPLMRLPDQYPASAPAILAAQVTEQTDTTAEVLFTLENRNRLEIKGMEIKVMDVVGEVRTYSEGASAQITGQGLNEDGTYYVTARLSDPVRYRSRYYVDSFTVGVAGNESTNYVVTPGEREKPEIPAVFYQEIENTDQWRTELNSSRIDVYGNYRLKADTFDFTNLPSEEFKTNYRITKAFYGSIDGGWTDEEGNEHTAVIKNINLGTYPYLFLQIRGSLKNLKVEGFTIDGSTGDNNSKALVQHLAGGQIDNVHIESARLQGAYRLGALTATASDGAVITNCSVKNSQLTTYSSTNQTKACVGGLVGRMDNTAVRNSFVQNLQIDNMDALDAEGVGGLIGCAGSDQAHIENCYTTGTIHSGYRNVGGLIGYLSSTSGRIRNCYSKVNIDVYGSFVGGLVGYLGTYENIQGNLSLGNLFVHSNSADGVHRLAGYSTISSFQENFGYANQMFNNQVDETDPDDVEEILTGTRLSQQETYTKILGWGSSYALQWEGQSVEQGYLPLLKSTEGHLLPDQTPVPISTEGMRIEPQSFGINQTAEEEYEAMFPGSAIPFSQTYKLMFSLYYNEGQYDIKDTYMDGMNLNAYMGAEHKPTWSISRQEDHFLVTYPFVVQELGGDVYCLNVVLQSKTDPDIQITVSSALEPPKGIATYISDAQTWNEVMAKAGNTYGNFILTEDIDAKDTGGYLVSNVKINSLSSIGGTWTIKNVKQEVTGDRNSLIQNCLSSITNVNFEDITWEVPEDKQSSSYENIGIIGMNQGTIQNVSFSRIKLHTGKGNYTGCVAYNLGEISDIKLSDIQLETLGSSAGGLCGYTMQPLKRITASGKLTPPADTDGLYTSTYEIKGLSRIGGIVGAGNAHDQIQVQGIAVTGTGTTVSRIGGIIGEGGIPVAGQSPDENAEHSSYITDSAVQAVYTAGDKSSVPAYIGGASGNGTLYYINGTNLSVTNPKGTYTGGLAGNGTVGSSSLITDENPDHTINGSKILGYGYTGGIVGSGGVSSSQTVGAEVKSLSSYAGGIAGRGSWVTGSIADRCRIEAASGAGGIAGESTSSINSSLLARSQVTASGPNAGGIIGVNSTAVSDIYTCGVIHSVITAGADSETGESNAGGIAGSLAFAGRIYSSYVKDNTQILAEGNNAGGIIGSGKGGHYYRNYTNARIQGKENVGGLIGHLTGAQTKLPSSYQKMSVYDSYSYSTVTGENRAGGIIGLYSADSDTQTMPNPENFHGVLVMGDTTAKQAASTAALFLNTEQGYAWKGLSLRIFSEASLNGIPAREMEAYKDAVWDTYRSQTGDPKLGEELLVTAKNLKEPTLYNGTYENGGMNWNTGWDFIGLGFTDEKLEAESKYKPTTGVTVNGTYYPPETKLITITPDSTTPIPTASLDENGTVWEWYRNDSPDTTSLISTGNKTKEMELAGRGYYIGRVQTNGTNYYSPVIKVLSDGYMPYLTESGNAAVRGAQEGLKEGVDPGVDSKDALDFYTGTDKLYYDGVVIPEGPDILTSQTEGLKDGSGITIYPSGADTVNIDLGPDYESVSHLYAANGSRTICDTGVIQRVYTFSYDYRQPITITLFSGGEQTTITAEPSSLQRTVMTWEDTYYYTCDGSLMDAEGVCLEEPVLHLWEGNALSEDGRVYRLFDGSSRAASLEPWTEETPIKPLWEQEYEGTLLRVTGGFTETAEDETVEQQLLVKKGRLYAMTGSGPARGFVVDSYNGLILASFLDEKGTLTDIGDPLKTPDGFSRKGIAHISSSLNSSQPYLLVRYQNGAAKGFNYITGEELPLENAFSDVSFLDFAADFTADFFGGSDEAASEFAVLKKLEGQLSLTPITDGQMAEAWARAEAGENAGEEILSDAGAGADGNSTADGEGSSEDSQDPVDRAENGSLEKENDRQAENGDRKEVSGDTDGTRVTDEDGADADEAVFKAEDEADADSEESDASENEASEDEAAAESTAQSETEAETGADFETSGETEASPAPSSSAADQTSGPEAGDASQSDSAVSIQPSEAHQKQETSQTGGYVYSFHTGAEGGSMTASLYRSADLLAEGSSHPLLSEEEKLELLISTGVVTEDTIQPFDPADRQHKKGIAMFAFTVSAALALSGVLIFRRRR